MAVVADCIEEVSSATCIQLLKDLGSKQDPSWHVFPNNIAFTDSKGASDSLWKLRDPIISPYSD